MPKLERMHFWVQWWGGGGREGWWTSLNFSTVVSSFLGGTLPWPLPPPISQHPHPDLSSITSLEKLPQDVTFITCSSSPTVIFLVETLPWPPMTPQRFSLSNELEKIAARCHCHHCFLLRNHLLGRMCKISSANVRQIFITEYLAFDCGENRVKISCKPMRRSCLN